MKVEVEVGENNVVGGSAYLARSRGDWAWRSSYARFCLPWAISFVIMARQSRPFRYIFRLE